MVYLGEQLSHNESLEHEYKEFCLKLNVFNYYDYEELEKIIVNGKLPSDFNTIIDDNILHYFAFYVPRYASVTRMMEVELRKLRGKTANASFPVRVDS